MSKKNVFKNPFLKVKSQTKNVDKDTVKFNVTVGYDEKGNAILKPVEHKNNRRGAFVEYKDLNVVAKDIAQELVKDNVFNAKIPLGASYNKVTDAPYQDIINDGLTFFMSQEAGQNRTGLLSLFPAISTGIRIYKAMHPKAPNRSKLLENITAGIEAMFKIIYRDRDWQNDESLKPVFDASPYVYEPGTFYEGDDEKGLNGRSFIESVSWAVPVFLSIMYIEKDKDDKDKAAKDDDKYLFPKYRDKAKSLAKWCLEYINKSLLTFKEKDENGNVKEVAAGWNFARLKTGGGDKRSLYFTYAASTVYLSFYAEYSNIIRLFKLFARAEYEGYIEFEQEPLKDIWKDDFKLANEKIDALAKKLGQRPTEEDVEMDVGFLVLDELEDIVEELKKQGYQQKLKDYFEFNDNLPAGYDGKDFDGKEVGAISLLKWRLEQIAEQIWEKVKGELENKFFYEDFNFIEADEEAIKRAGQNTALFSGLLYIGIILNCAYDSVVRYDKYNDESEKAYEELQDTLLLHVQKTQRFFDKLADKGKSFGVDSLIVRFAEDFASTDKKVGNKLTDYELAEMMRKQSIRVSSLTPMLLRTNSLISEYVVEYPQKQMGESLARIAQNRRYDRTVAEEKDRYLWYWETDYYHALSNYYYIGAIFDFYNYYNKHEKLYVSSYEKMREILKEDFKFTDSANHFYQEIANEKLELKKQHEDALLKKDAEMIEVRKEVEVSKTGSELVKNIEQVIKNSTYFSEKDFFKKLLDGMRNQLAGELVAEYKTYKPAEDKAMLAALETPAPAGDDLLSQFRALLADIILPSAIVAKRAKDGSGNIKDLGLSGLEDMMSAEFAVEARKRLLGEDSNLMNKLFALMFEQFHWKK